MIVVINVDVIFKNISLEGDIPTYDINRKTYKLLLEFYQRYNIIFISNIVDLEKQSSLIEILKKEEIPHDSIYFRKSYHKTNLEMKIDMARAYFISELSLFTVDDVCFFVDNNDEAVEYLKSIGIESLIYFR